MWTTPSARTYCYGLLHPLNEQRSYLLLRRPPLGANSNTTMLETQAALLSPLERTEALENQNQELDHLIINWMSDPAAVKQNVF